MNIGTLNLNLLDRILHNDSLITENDSNLYKSYVKLIESSPILSTELKVINNISKLHIDDTTLALRFLDENVKLFEIYSLDEFDNEHNKLQNIAGKYNLSESTYVNSNETELYNSITTLIRESLMDYEEKDVNKLFEAQTFVVNYIKSNNAQEANYSVDTSEINEDIIKIAIKKFNEKYNTLNEEDLTLMKTLNSNYNKKLALYETYKNKAIEFLSESLTDELNSETKDYVIKSIDKLKSHKPTQLTINEDLFKTYELLIDME